MINQTNPKLYTYDFEQQNIVIKIGYSNPPKSPQLSQIIDPSTFRYPFPLPASYYQRAAQQKKYTQQNLIFNQPLNYQPPFIKIQDISDQKKPEEKTNHINSNSYFSILNRQLLCDIANYIQYEEDKIRDIKKKIQNMRLPIQLHLFQLYVTKLKMMKKTKQEKLKFLIRRSFRNIQFKKTIKPKPKSSAYFKKNYYSIKDTQNFQSLFSILTMRFSQKALLDALQKHEYRELFIDSLQSAEQQFHEQNKKKVIEIIKIMQKCLNQKTATHLKARMKMPWTKIIFDNIIKYGYDLLEQAKKNDIVKSMDQQSD